MTSSLDFKQQDCSLDELKSAIDSDSNSELLSHKLHELMLIIDEYESELEGRYIDSEDYISMYVSLSESRRYLIIIRYGCMDLILLRPSRWML